MRSVRAITRGRVQGVGFRWFTQNSAAAHGVTGWVRNRTDGSVEAELHGADADVQAVIDALAQGPSGARVDEVTVTDVTVTDAPTTTARRFEIRATD